MKTYPKVAYTVFLMMNTWLSRFYLPTDAQNSFVHQLVNKTLIASRSTVQL